MTEKETGDGRDSIGGIGMDAKKKEREATLKLNLKAASGYRTEAEYEVSPAQWGDILRVCEGTLSSAALAQPAQGEPVAYLIVPTEKSHPKFEKSLTFQRPHDRPDWAVVNLYSAPQLPADTIAVPMAEYEAMKRDAERYQYLRDPQSIGMDVHINGYFDDSFCDTRLDAAIDAAKSTGEDV